eukprot:scpid19804/ scgid15737/ Nucleoporin NUP188 homolog
MSSALSIHTCLGSQAVPIREKFVSRLSARTESVSTKVAILEMLTVAVQLQPGLIELFLDLTPIDGASGSKDFTMSRGSCLHPILLFLDKKTSCPAELRCAALGFLYGLWKDRRVSALQAIKKSTDFWTNILSSLFEDLPSWKENEDLYCLRVKVATHIIRILTVELYYCDSVSTGLLQQLTDLSEKKRYLYWLEQLTPVCTDVDMEDAGESSVVSTSSSRKVSDSRYELLKGLQSLLMIAVTCQASSCKLESLTACSAILNTVLETLRSHISSQHTAESVQSPLQLASLFLFLCKNCQRSILAPEQVLDSLASLLVHAFQTDRAVVQLAWPNLSASLLIIIRLVRRYRKPPPEAVGDLLQVFCQCLHALRDNVATKNSQALLTSVYVLCELIPWLPTSSPVWRSALDQFAICTLLTHILEHCLMTREHPELVEAILSLYVVLSQIPKGAEAVASPSLVHQLCLSLARVLAMQTMSNGASATHSAWDRPTSAHAVQQHTATSSMTSGAMASAGAAAASSSLYATATSAAGGESNGGISNSSGSGSSGVGVGGSSTPATSSMVWFSVWSLALQLITNILTALRHHFIQSALDFVCAHQERLAETLGFISTHCIVKRHVDVVRHTTALLHCLSAFHHQWHLTIPQNFNVLQGEVLRLCHRCCSLLSRPKLLSRLAESGHDIGHYDTSQARLMLRRLSASPPASQRTPSTAQASAGLGKTGTVSTSNTQVVSGLGASSSTKSNASPIADQTNIVSSTTGDDGDDDDDDRARSKRKRGSLATGGSAAATASSLLKTTTASTSSGLTLGSSAALSQMKTSTASSLSSTAGASSTSSSSTGTSNSSSSSTQPQSIPVTTGNAGSSRGLRRSRLSFSEEDPEPEQVSQNALNLQRCLIHIIGDCLGFIQRLTPSISDILLNTALDKADSPLLFTCNFDTVPSLDEHDSVSFGDAVACVEACIRFLPRGASSHVTSPRKARRLTKEVGSPTKSPTKSHSSKSTMHDRTQVMYVVESALLVLMVQAGSYLRHPDMDADQKRAMQWELSSMMGNLLSLLSRQLHTRNVASSPEYKSSRDASLFSMENSEQSFLALAEAFVKTVLH